MKVLHAERGRIFPEDPFRLRGLGILQTFIERANIRIGGNDIPFRQFLVADRRKACIAAAGDAQMPDMSGRVG